MSDSDRISPDTSSVDDAQPATGAPPPGVAAAPTPGEWAKAQADLEALQAALKDSQLRALAELDNVRKRAARDAAQNAKYGAEKLLRDLLQIADSLELALKADADGTAKAVLEGVELTQRQLVKVLEKHGVTIVAPAGEIFDPTLHEAVAVIENAAVPANHVVEVMQTGYCLHERLLRPARVVVAKAPAQAS